ncbi:polysaccharide lyase family 8 super-sandwich domain-containing protein [Aquiflexum sp.]|uniref:polysaccharide lyase family 8 super-sandwich domain-containing protein n=1 Tax=Aquiflexum sp. TaxID=1872584 RepID=UPI0035931558
MNPKNNICRDKWSFWGLGLVLYLLCFPPLLADNLKDIKTIQERIIAELLENEINPEEIEELLTTQLEDGTWPGIDYKDVSRTGFEHRIHSGNMVTLSRAYSKRGSKYRKNKRVRNAIEKALANWVENDYFCDNWWHNQIGTPGNLVHVMLLAGNDMPKELTEKAQPIIGRAHLEASGARPSGDRIKIAGILAKNLLFVADYQQFDVVIRVIEGEIKFSEGRGMQYDYSFHHRVDRVNNTLSYGLGYADAFVEWAGYVADTDYAFSTDKIQLLVDYYLDGICKSMVYGKYPDAGVKNRSVARAGALKPMHAETPKKMLLITDYRSDELKEIIQIREGSIKNTDLSHSTFYWHSEHFAFQRPTYYASVRMFSTRNYNMEVPYNSEGLKNHHRGDGTNHLSLTGEEYLDIFPVMDYQKIPGATILQKEKLPDENQIQKPGLTDFVGAVTDGMYGAVAFDFKSPHDPLEAKKTWFFFDNEYMCLGAGITGRSNRPVHTTLNQNLLKGNVTVNSIAGQKTQNSGDHELDGVNWIHSDGAAYLFTEPQKVSLSNGPAKGYWWDISKQSSTPKEKVTLDVFKLWLDHGNRPQGETYSYVVLPHVDVEETRGYDLQGSLKVLSNTDHIQAVHHKKLGITMVVFYQAGALDLGEGLHLTMDGPGTLILHHQGKTIHKIAAADPGRKLGKLHFSLNTPIGIESKGLKTQWNADKGISDLSVELPKGVYAGKSISFE